eukprot:2784435-Rhodomonas_salina.1
MALAHQHLPLLRVLQGAWPESFCSRPDLGGGVAAGGRGLAMCHWVSPTVSSAQALLEVLNVRLEVGGSPGVVGASEIP